MFFIPVWQSARKKWWYDFKPNKEVSVSLYHTGAYRLTSSPVPIDSAALSVVSANQFVRKRAIVQHARRTTDSTNASIAHNNVISTVIIPGKATVHGCLSLCLSVTSFSISRPSTDTSSGKVK